LELDVFLVVNRETFLRVDVLVLGHHLFGLDALLFFKLLKIFKDKFLLLGFVDSIGRERKGVNFSDFAHDILFRHSLLSHVW
jgi:hypothetical protein